MKISENKLAIASVISILGLLCIWVIPNTIALRHLLLVVACLSAIELIRCNWSSLRAVNTSYLPLFSILGLFVWVIIHYTFFSLNPQLELSEIKGLWMRSLLGFIAAVGLGIAITKHPKLRLYFYIGLFLTPAINVFAYCWASYLKHGLLKPNEFVFFLFAKVETAYFGAVAAAVAVGNLVYLLPNRIQKSNYKDIIFWVLGLLLVLLSAFISSTMNGMAAAAGLCFLLAFVVLIKAFLGSGNSKKFALFFSVLTILVALMLWQAQNIYTHKGWGMVIYDSKLALDIENNLQWKGDAIAEVPLNSAGHKVAPSTYIRFAYAAVGIKLISKYPFGYGSINQSFDGLLEYFGIEHIPNRQAHSGWIDFGLAFGIPGLLLIFTSLLSIIYFGIKSKSSIALPWVVLCLVFIPFGLVAEISYKQYFEATIFFITVGSTVIIFTGNKFNEDSKNISKRVR